MALDLKLSLPKIRLGKAKTKQAKISKAQQVILVSVGMASIAIGVTLVMSIHFVKYIFFNTEVITAKEEAITQYSETIRKTGTCRAPRGEVYTGAELDKCDPNSIAAEEVPGTLRYNVLVDLAKNTDLESVARETEASCQNPDTKKNYTYDELMEKYESSADIGSRGYWLTAIKVCSALRVVPDAMPTAADQESLLASLNQLFVKSDWIPETLVPSGMNTVDEESEETILEVPVSLSIEASDETALRVIRNIERSIREYSITVATIEWLADDQLSLEANAKAFYVEPGVVTENSRTISGKGAR